MSKNWKVMVDSNERLTKAGSRPPKASLKKGPNMQDQLVRANTAFLVGRGNMRMRRVGPGLRVCKERRKSSSLLPFTATAADKKTSGWLS